MALEIETELSAKFEFGARVRSKTMAEAMANYVKRAREEYYRSQGRFVNSHIVEYPDYFQVVIKYWK